jgi:hypothetical protein
MKIKKMNSLKSLLILLILILIIRAIPQLPWWSFTMSVIITGAIIKGRDWKISFFGTGFLAGFLIWACGNFYFDWIYPGDLLTNVAELLFLPKIVFFLISGIIGGLITGLAFYSGKTVILTENNISGTK